MEDGNVSAEGYNGTGRAYFETAQVSSTITNASHISLVFYPVCARLVFR